MKTQLLALSLVATSGLLAEDAPRYTAQASACSTCCCTPCCCKPQPTECVSGVAYTVPFYDLQCDWGISIDVEFLYWYARETDLSYALNFTAIDRGDETSSDPLVLFAPNTYKYVDSAWDPGFRVGLGWNMECDGWDVFLSYTWMRNKKTTSTSVPSFDSIPNIGASALINPWINQSVTAQTFLPNIDGQLFEKISAKWRLQWNVVDLELGRKYWLSSCFNLRPYAGLRGAWWKTRFRTISTYEGVSLVSQPSINSIAYKDRFTNRNWGVGVIGGLQPTWYFCCNFALYGNFDMALLWGNLEAKKRENYFAESSGSVVGVLMNYSNRASSKFSQMTPVLDAAIGFRWEETWCCDRYRTIIDLGWEHHVYFDQNHRMKTLEPARNSVNPSLADVIDTQIQYGFKTYASEAGNIGLGGFVLRGRFDF